jgi:hypothetical protein
MFLELSQRVQRILRTGVEVDIADQRSSRLSNVVVDPKIWCHCILHVDVLPTLRSFATAKPQQRAGSQLS